MKKIVVIVMLTMVTAMAITVSKAYAYRTSWVYVQARLQNPAKKHFDKYVLSNLRRHHLSQDGKLKNFTIYVYQGHKYDPSRLLHKRKVRGNRTDASFTLYTGKVYFFVAEMKPGRVIYSGGRSYRIANSWQQWVTIRVPNYR